MQSGGLAKSLSMVQHGPCVLKDPLSDTQAAIANALKRTFVHASEKAHLDALTMPHAPNRPDQGICRCVRASVDDVRPCGAYFLLLLEPELICLPMISLRIERRLGAASNLYRSTGTA